MNTRIRYCTATSKRTKKPCRARAMRGMHVCYHHGGKSRRGWNHWNFKHGFYSTEPIVKIMWAMITDRYRREQARLRVNALLAANTESLESPRNWKRFMKSVRVALREPYLPIPRERAAELWQERYSAYGRNSDI